MGVVVIVIIVTVVVVVTAVGVEIDVITFQKVWSEGKRSIEQWK